MNERIMAVANTLIFIAVVVVNGLANALPINGHTTGALSDMYPNLFVPAGITFSIWGVIYLLILAFVIYQLVVAFRGNVKAHFFHAIGHWFFVSCVANIAWILAWHYLFPVLSLLIMIVLLGSLIFIYLNLDFLKPEMLRGERLFVLPLFSIYLGWITVATIANATTVLVHFGWNGGGIHPGFWTIVMISIATIMGIYLIMKKHDALYALVIVWALLGIYLKRSAAEDINRGIIIASVIGMSVNIIAVLALVVKGYLRRTQ